MTVPGLIAVAVVLTATIWLWVPLTALADLVRLRRRLPLLRLLAFATWWAWLEVFGVLVAGVLWVTGQRSNLAAHYWLQRWWATNILRAIRTTCGLTLTVEGIEHFRPAPVLVFARHVSLADSLVTVGAVAVQAGLRPRVVLKRELLFDPCLDIVGQRIPNHFLDRHANDSAPELEALRVLTAGLGPDGAGVIFPEGTRANPAKRAKAFERLAERDPARAERLGGLQALLPPRPSGAKAMAEGAPTADIVLGWHVGLEGMDDFPGILRAIGRGNLHVRCVFRRVPRSEVGDDFVAWLDDAWVGLDAEVSAELAARAARAAHKP